MAENTEDQFMETALVALTWIEATQNPDAETAAADQTLLLETYGMEEIHKGAMLTLAVMLALNAYVSDQKFTDRIAHEREMLIQDLPEKFDLEKILIALSYIELDQNPDRRKAAADKNLIIKTYGRDYIYDGALLALTVMLMAQARTLAVSLPENNARIRRMMRDNMHFEPGE